jgi:adenosylmethionine-8-amino-7-oxononanoate aminotransferase
MALPLRIWHPFTNAALDPPPLRVVRAEVVHLHTADGRKIIDAVSSWCVNLHGHANARIATAIAEQARKMKHVILAGFTSDAAEELAGRLRKWVMPKLTHLFFSDDGSTAHVISPDELHRVYDIILEAIQTLF